VYLPNNKHFSFLLDRLVQYEGIDDSSDDSDGTELSGGEEEKQKKPGTINNSK